MTVAERYRIQSLERAFTLLHALSEAGPDGLTVSQLARAGGVSKSAAYSILQTMLAHRYVADSGTGMSRRYRLGMALARLGDLVVSQVALRDVAMPVLRSLTNATGLTSRAAVLDAPYAVVVGRVDVPNATVRFAAGLGRREHLHCSAVGKAVLAELGPVEVSAILEEAGLPRKTAKTIVDPQALFRELAHVADRGYAIDDEEDTEGVFCVGAAVTNHAGECIGAISVTAIKLDLPAWRVRQIGETVSEHAARISDQLGAPREVVAEPAG
jgi:IclR family transcriptional regulator, acetate operon repressor